MLTNNHPFSVSRASWFLRFKEVNILQTQTHIACMGLPITEVPPSVALIFCSGSGEPPPCFLRKIVPGETRSRLVVSTTTPSCQSLGSQTLSETTHRMDPGLGSDENPTLPWSPAGSWKNLGEAMPNQWLAIFHGENDDKPMDFSWRYHIFRQTHIYIWCSQMFSSKMCHLCCESGEIPDAFLHFLRRQPYANAWKEGISGASRSRPFAKCRHISVHSIYDVIWCKIIQ